MSSGLGSARSVLRSQEGSGKEELSRCARGVLEIAFNARSSPIPLRCLRCRTARRSVPTWVVVRVIAWIVPWPGSERRCRERGRRQYKRSNCIPNASFRREGRTSAPRAGVGLIASNARCGPIPLPRRLRCVEGLFRSGRATLLNLNFSLFVGDFETLRGGIGACWGISRGAGCWEFESILEKCFDSSSELPKVRPAFGPVGS